MRVLRIVMVVILGFLVVHAAAYGVGFLADPDGGMSEFGYEVADTADDEADDAARILVRFTGIAMLGLAAFSALAAWMIGKGDGAGLSLALVLGAGRLMIGVTAAFDDHLWFDALFFGITGLLVTVGAGVLWASGRVHPRTASA